MMVRVIVEDDMSTELGTHHSTIVMAKSYYDTLTASQVTSLLTADAARWVVSQQNTVDAQPKPRILSRYGFLSLFTIQEQAGMSALETNSDATIATTAQAFSRLINVADEINLDETVTSEGLDFLVTCGVINGARKTEILSL